MLTVSICGGLISYGIETLIDRTGRNEVVV